MPLWTTWGKFLRDSRIRLYPEMTHFSWSGLLELGVFCSELSPVFSWPCPESHVHPHPGTKRRFHQQDEQKCVWYIKTQTSCCTLQFGDSFCWQGATSSSQAGISQTSQQTSRQCPRRHKNWQKTNPLIQRLLSAQGQVNTEIQKMVDIGAVERVHNVNTPGFYSRIFLVPKRTGDIKPVIDLKLLNTCSSKNGSRWRLLRP